MTDEVAETVEPKTTPGLDPANIDISDFITSSHHIDLLHKNYVAIGHSGDFVEVAATKKAADHLGIALDRLRVRFNFRKTKDGKTKTTNDVDVGPWEDAVRISNDQVGGGADVNAYVSVVEVSATAVPGDPATGTPEQPAQTIKPAGGQASTRTDSNTSEFPWWIVGVGVTAAIIIVIAIYLWKRGRPAAMPSPGAAPAAAPAAPNITVVK